MSTDFVKRIFETCFITVGAFGTHAEVLTACSRRSGSTVRRSVGSELNCTPGKRGGGGFVFAFVVKWAFISEKNGITKMR